MPAAHQSPEEVMRTARRASGMRLITPPNVASRTEVAAQSGGAAGAARRPNHIFSARCRKDRARASLQQPTTVAATMTFCAHPSLAAWPAPVFRLRAPAAAPRPP
jgi:hypothetical protein